MAISKVADRATANSNSAVTNVDLVLSSLTVGHVLIIRTAADNSGGSGAARTITVTNQSGTAIDTATDQAFQRNNDPGAASAGVTLNVIVATITATSGTVRVTYSGSVVQAAVAEQWSGIDPTSPVVGTPVGADGVASTNLASTTDSSVASGNLAYGATAIEGPASDTITKDADTTNGSWTDLTKLGTSNATATDNVTVYGAYKVVTGTAGQTHNPTINNARDSAGLILEFAALAGVSLTVADSAHGHTADAVALTQHNVLAVVDAAHGHTADPVTLTAHEPSTTLVVADTAHSHASEGVALTQHNALTVADTGHGHTVDALALTQHNVLVIADASHGHTVEPVVLVQHHVLAVADASHSHTAEAVTLTQGVSLVVADAFHSHTTDSLGLVQHHILTGLSDSSHAHTTEPLALTQHHVLTVADTFHAHSSEAVQLIVLVTLVVADSLHRHTADHVGFVTSLRIMVAGREPATTVTGSRGTNTAVSRRPRTSISGREPGSHT